MKLITRLYDPTSGRVLLDGVDLRDYDIEDLHREIGVIFQDFVRYEMSARAEHRRRPPATRPTTSGGSARRPAAASRTT